MLLPLLLVAGAAYFLMRPSTAAAAARGADLQEDGDTSVPPAAAGARNIFGNPHDVGTPAGQPPASDRMAAIVRNEIMTANARANTIASTFERLASAPPPDHSQVVATALAPTPPALKSVPFFMAGGIRRPST